MLYIKKDFPQWLNAEQKSENSGYISGIISAFVKAIKREWEIIRTYTKAEIGDEPSVGDIVKLALKDAINTPKEFYLGLYETITDLLRLGVSKQEISQRTSIDLDDIDKVLKMNF